jgi:phosphate-selective porin OprO and OprP
MLNLNSIKSLRSVLAASLLISTLTTAELQAGPVTDDKKATAAATITPLSDSLSLGDRLDNIGRLYQNKESDFLNEFWILGRYHGHYHWSDGSAGEDEGHEIRRLRMGAQATLFKKLTLHAQMVSGSDADPFYNGFTELWAGWAFKDWLILTVGQQKHRFSHDRNVSSRYLNYLERGMLTNMFGLDYTPAITLSGRTNKIWYYTGLFSNATGGNMREAFTELDSGWSYLASFTYDLGKSLGTDTAHVNLGYLYSEAKENATNLSQYDHGASAALILTNGSASLLTEALLGVGGEDGSAYGINIQPGYFLTDEIQIVGRYQLVGSQNEDGLKGQKRYEREAGLPAGDLYQAFYGGVNYYIAKHRIKLMTGIEYATMGGEHVWTASTMVRVYFGPHSGAPFPANVMLPGRF